MCMVKGVVLHVLVSGPLLVSMHLSSGVPSGLPCGVLTLVSASADVTLHMSPFIYLPVCLMVSRHARDSKEQFRFYKDCANGILL